MGQMTMKEFIDKYNDGKEIDFDEFYEKIHVEDEINFVFKSGIPELKEFENAQHVQYSAFRIGKHDSEIQLLKKVDNITLFNTDVLHDLMAIEMKMYDDMHPEGTEGFFSAPIASMRRGANHKAIEEKYAKLWDYWERVNRRTIETVVSTVFPTIYGDVASRSAVYEHIIMELGVKREDIPGLMKRYLVDTPEDVLEKTPIANIDNMY